VARSGDCPGETDRRLNDAAGQIRAAVRPLLQTLDVDQQSHLWVAVHPPARRGTRRSIIVYGSTNFKITTPQAEVSVPLNTVGRALLSRLRPGHKVGESPGNRCCFCFADQCG
jgi:hypothetical protein